MSQGLMIAGQGIMKKGRAGKGRVWWGGWGRAGAYSLAVASKGISEQAGELGLPEGHMPLLAAEGIHCLLQKCQ